MALDDGPVGGVAGVPAPVVESPGLFAVRIPLVAVGALAAGWLAKLALTQLSARSSDPHDSHAAPE